MLVSSFIIFTLSYDSYTLQPTILRCRLLLNWWASCIHMRQWITIITITCAWIRCLWVQLHDDNVVIQLFSWHTWSTSTPLCQHRSPGSTLFQTFHHPLFRLPPHRSGTHYQTQAFRHQHCGRSSTNWKLFFYFNDSLFISTVIVVSQ